MDQETTCTEAGSKSRHCSRCNAKTDTEEIPATGQSTDQNQTVPDDSGSIDNSNTSTNPDDSLTKLPSAGQTLTDTATNAVYIVDVQGRSIWYKGPSNKKTTNAVIPSTVTISGVPYPVTGISANAFAGCKKLKSVKIGKNITTIGTKAFEKCTKLTKITIPSKVNYIGKQAFYNCSSLKSITIKTGSLTKKSVGAKAFKGIHKKAVIKVPAKQKASYKKLLITKGAGKRVKIK